MARNIYVKKAEVIDRYVIYEKTEDGRDLEKLEFGDRQGLINYFLNGNDDYINKIRKRGKRVFINLNISDKDTLDDLEKILSKSFRVKRLKN